MAAVFISGFFLGLGLIAAIGAQNAFVLRHGLRREHVAAVVAFCAISDAVLIALGVSGFSAASRAAPWLGDVMLWGGIGFLIWYGARAFRAAWAGGAAIDPTGGAGVGLWPTLAMSAVLTWGNPHVYLDTVVILGSVAAQYPGQQFWFAVGAMTASFSFFATLGFGARLAAPLFTRPAAWRVLDVVIGCTMWAIAAKLALG